MLNQWWSLLGVTTTRDFVRRAGNGSPAPQRPRWPSTAARNQERRGER